MPSLIAYEDSQSVTWYWAGDSIRGGGDVWSQRKHWATLFADEEDANTALEALRARGVTKGAVYKVK